jgi:hypothetical protein
MHPPAGGDKFIEDGGIEPRLTANAAHFHNSFCRLKVKLLSRKYLAKFPLKRAMIAPVYLASYISSLGNRHVIFALVPSQSVLELILARSPA